MRASLSIAAATFAALLACGSVASAQFKQGVLNEPIKDPGTTSYYAQNANPTGGTSQQATETGSNAATGNQSATGAMAQHGAAGMPGKPGNKSGEAVTPNSGAAGTSGQWHSNTGTGNTNR
jgi:hypothetical protein